MNAIVEAVLKDFHDRADREHELMNRLSREEFDERLDEFLLPVGPETGRFLNLLAKTAGARHIVEIGTSHGYSAIWLAEAARETGGRVSSLDIHEGKQAYARKALESAGLDDQVDLILGDALATIPALREPIDFVLLDCWKNLYIPCFDVLVPRLAPGALIAADNMLYPESARKTGKAYQAHVRATPSMESVLVPIGNGIELTRFAA